MKSPSKILYILLTLILVAFALSGCAGKTTGETQPPSGEGAEVPEAEVVESEEAPPGEMEPIKILMPVSQTGNFVAIETYVLTGAQVAVEEINSAGGVNGRPVELIIEDTKSTVDGAIAAFQKLILSNSDAPVVYVPLMSHFVTALMPYIEEEGITTFTGASHVSVTGSGNPWMFRVRLNDQLKTTSSIDYVLDELGAESVAIFHDTSDYGVGGYENILARMEDRGVADKMILEETMNVGDEDFRPQLLNIAAANPSVLIVWSQSQEAALILRQMVELGIDIPSLGSSFPPAQPTWDLAGPEASEGAYGIPEPFTGPSAPQKALDFLAAYEDFSGQKPSDFALNGYDVIQMIAIAASKAGTEDRVAFREAVRSNEYDGLVTHYRFDQNGDGVWVLPITQIVDGVPVLVAEVKVQE